LRRVIGLRSALVDVVDTISEPFRPIIRCLQDRSDGEEEMGDGGVERAMRVCLIRLTYR
jgi:hypothetical protein